MSEEERMDRARRIKQLREGRRADESARDGGDAVEEADPDEDEADPGEDEADPGEDEADPGEDETDLDDVDPAADAGEEPEDADATAADAAESGDATAALDDAVVEAVERVSDASAPVPSPEEMTDVEDAPGQTPGGDSTADAGEDGESAAGQGALAGDDIADGQSEDDGGESDAGPDDGFGPGAEPAVGHRATADTRVLEFTLGDECYCIDIEYVEEIVKDETITRVPNTPDFVEGVVDLRGQITTILDPKRLLETEETEPGDLLVVFDSDAFDDQGHLGWIVDDVQQVAPVADEEVDDPPVQEDYVNGVIDRGEDDPFVVWTSPEEAIESAT